MSDEITSVRALHDAFAGPLYVYAYRALGDPGAAEEVVQDTLVRAWRNIDRYDAQRGAVSTWLYSIARNRIIDDRRRRAARPQTVARDPGDAGMDVVDEDADFERTIESWYVAEALAELSEAHRGAIVECYYRGSTVAEAADRLGVPPGTVKSRLFYGLRQLRLRLEEMGVVS
jgi:RNA polymerase sigma-70 factor, ECF subfamily